MKSGDAQNLHESRREKGREKKRELAKCQAQLGSMRGDNDISGAEVGNSCVMTGRVLVNIDLSSE